MNHDPQPLAVIMQKVQQQDGGLLLKILFVYGRAREHAQNRHVGTKGFMVMVAAHVAAAQDFCVSTMKTVVSTFHGHTTMKKEV